MLVFNLDKKSFRKGVGRKDGVGGSRWKMEEVKAQHKDDKFWFIFE